MQISNKDSSPFDLVLTPDGVYLSDGRPIPSADNTSLGVNHRQPIVGVHNGDDLGKGILCAEQRIDVEEGVLELVPLPESLDSVSDGGVVLSGRIEVVDDKQIMSHGVGAVVGGSGNSSTNTPAQEGKSLS
jgi:hypothetical protein